jgi:hypothetical protein
MSDTDLSYAIGTVSVSADGTIVTGNGTIWSGVNARQWDWIAIDGADPVPITSVTDETHLTIAPWAGGDKSAVDYVIYQLSPLRFAGGQAMADVSTMIARINTQGFVWTLPTGVHTPDGYVAEDGQYIEDTSTNERWKMESGVWVSQGIADPVFSRYDLAVDVPGRPASGSTIAKWVAPSAVTFRASLAESVANAGTAATTSTVFSLKKNGTEFATATFAASGTTATFACAADTTFAAGDVLTLVAPTRDDTLADIAFTIVGFR